MKKICLLFVSSILTLAVQAQLFAPEIKVMQIANNNVGIGIDNPDSKLYIKCNDDQSSALKIQRYSVIKGFEINNYVFQLYDYVTNKSIWSAYNSNLGLGIDLPTSKLQVECSYDSNWATMITNSGITNASGLYVNIGVNSTGTPFRVDKAGISLLNVANNGDATVKGKIYATDYIGKVNGADFVFDKNYYLKSLSETEKFIIENKHLPEIASANEMKEKGVNIAELQMKLLQKIEELTLYTIEQNKKIVELEKQNAKIEQQNQELQMLKEEIEKLKVASK